MKSEKSKGIYLDKKRNMWYVRVQVNKKDINSRYYESQEKALQIKQEMLEKYKTEIEREQKIQNIFF